ncbi:glycosyltransferase family 4 protein [Arthrobacter sp. B2a2-09]|uniref:glycosyltransferase family 4 protein n=1 Tax=Arthrobacter sp. B2a2-09 TaxID=2952822 RepID=UPI0022CD86BD|nr:glycosyltransferase family 4 protein [Arthrobacter sp. B2a2-09]MCZ9882309.1 glycosyltransferase family 4 protein [Arthrobacter sp. B2a2-09]
MIREAGDRQSHAMFLHSSNEMYGADRILLEIVGSLPVEDQKNTLVCLPDDLPGVQNGLGKELDVRGIENISVPLAVIRRRYLSFSGLLPLLRRLWMTYKLLLAERPRVVYCTTSAMIFCLPLARLAGIKNVVLHVQEIWSPREGSVMGLFARGASQIICISRASLDSLPRHLRSRSVLLINAHRESGLPLSPYLSDSEALQFVVASRWNSWKGHATLLHAWDQDRSPGDLVILGGSPAMGTGVDVPALVASVKHSDRISVVGEVSDIAPYLDSADFLILPSDQPEPFGLVLLEAFARGRAVVASDAGGAKDVVTDGRDGKLFQMGSSEELAACLFSLSRQDAEQMGANARVTYEEKFSIASYGERFREIWCSVSNDGSGREDAHG